MSGVVKVVAVRTAMIWETSKFGGCGGRGGDQRPRRQRDRLISLTCLLQNIT